MNKQDVLSELGISEYVFNQDTILEFSRYMRLQELSHQPAIVLINDDFYEVTVDEVLVILGLMRDHKIGIYKNTRQELFPVQYAIMSWTDLTETWAGDFINNLKRAQLLENFSVNRF